MDKSPVKKRSKKLSGAAAYSTKYDPSWSSMYPVKPATSSSHFFCIVCSNEFSCAHQGEADIKRHIGTKSHSEKASSLQKQPKLNFVPQSDPITFKVSRAEVLMTNFIVENNLPIAVADRCGPLFRSMFPDSQIAKQYQCAKTKTYCILNGALAPSFHKELVSNMNSGPFSLATDGSNDSDLTKMNPVTVRIFDVNRNVVTTNFLDMCTTTGATAEAIFSKIDAVLTQNRISWDKCVSFAVDNASVNMGKRNSIKSRVVQTNPDVYFIGCPCHMVHNAARKGGNAFSALSGFDVEDLVVDLYYWFDKSTKRKNELNGFCGFCDTEYKQVLKHVSTRWLSLEKAVQRTLEMYQPLKSYFLSGAEKQPRFKRLATLFNDPMTEVYLLFYQYALQQFVCFNLLLQREEPTLYLVEGEMQSFLRKLLTKFVKVKPIKESPSLLDVDITNPENLLAHDELQIGFTTRQALRKLESEGDITSGQKRKFNHSVFSFYNETTNYVKKTFPFNDQVLMHSKFLNFEERLEADFVSVQFFVNRFQKVLNFTDREMDAIEDQFKEFQLLPDVPEEISKAAKVTTELEDGSKSTMYRMDVIWSMYVRQTCPLLFKVAEVVLVIPHSNAEEERVFSLVRKNKTDFRASLKTDGSLSSILKVKLNNKDPSHKFEPSKELVDQSKKATWEYNKQHQ